MKNVQTADSGGLVASHAVARPNMSSGVSGPPVSGLISKAWDPISEITCVWFGLQHLPPDVIECSMLYNLIHRLGCVFLLPPLPNACAGMMRF